MNYKLVLLSLCLALKTMQAMEIESDSELLQPKKSILEKKEYINARIETIMPRIKYFWDQDKYRESRYGVCPYCQAKLPSFLRPKTIEINVQNVKKHLQACPIFNKKFIKSRKVRSATNYSKQLKIAIKENQVDRITTGNNVIRYHCNNCEGEILGNTDPIDCKSHKKYYPTTEIPRLPNQNTIRYLESLGIDLAN